MKISIEVPVFKGEFLQQCIDSVLNQTSDAWQLSLVWDGGDGLSREILEKINALGNPKIDVYFTPNQGIARARAFLSSQNSEAYILPLDDDDELAPNAVEVLQKEAKAKPWASLIRAKRGFIDERSEIVEKTQWFPFGPRNYYKGMVTDVFNQAQPYLIRRSAYEQTLGWRGFDDFMQAGEDCDVFLQVEEIAHFELVDEILYHYRLHSQRASDTLKPVAAFEMWRRLADDALQRMELPLIRTNDTPPFQYQSKKRSLNSLENVEFIVPQNSLLIESLLQLGVEEKAIIEAPSSSNTLTWKMAGFKKSSQALICFLDGSIKVSDVEALERFVDLSNDTEADVLTPIRSNSTNEGNTHSKPKRNQWLLGGCLLVRREVLLATGGFDETYIPESLQDIDFSIQASHRNFSCYEALIPGFEYDSSTSLKWTDEELDQLQKKWESHEGLSESIKELSNVSGVGAL